LNTIKEFLDSEGLKIELFKWVADSYRTSWHRMSGVSMDFGQDVLRIGPESTAQRLIEPSMKKLDLMDYNAAAIYSLMADWHESPLRNKGLVFLVPMMDDMPDVLIRIGPASMKDPIVIASRRLMETKT
jgi:hypothetical protein